MFKEINGKPQAYCQSVLTNLVDVSSMPDRVKDPLTTQTDSKLSVLLLVFKKCSN